MTIRVPVDRVKGMLESGTRSIGRSGPRLVPVLVLAALLATVVRVAARDALAGLDAELAGLVMLLLACTTGISLVMKRHAANDAEAADRLAGDLATERKTLRESEERFRSLVLNTSDVITIMDPNAQILYQSPSAERIWGYAPRELAQTSLLSLVHADDLEVATNLITQAISRPRLGLAAELRLRLADGTWSYFEVVMTNLLRDPRVAGLVSTFRDISERKNFEQALSYQAFHDALTDLPNRSLFVDRVERALARGNLRQTPVAVMFLDLDNFKVINDSLGHSIGDQLLVSVTHRIQSCLRREDTLSRLSGDEFSILIEEVPDIEDALAVTQRIQQALEAPFSLDGHELFASASIGVVLSAPNHDCPDDLLRDADLAMYRAKANGKARCEVFDHTMNARVTERLALETSLRRALDRDEFRVHYQPIIDLATGEVAGFEALIRWEHPQRGLVPPAEFIPLAEETGLILPIGRWVLEEACQQIKTWQMLYDPEHRLTLSVNVSARQLQHQGLVETVADVLERTELDPTTLKLELTESLMMQDLDLTIDRLRALKALNIELALDDFGTGYSSLAYLRRLPVSFLKIDRSFVKQLGVDPDDSAIVRTIVALAHDLGMTVIGEGVETEGQFRELRRLGCAYGQGYHFGRPVPAAVAERMLAGAPARALAS